MDSCSLDGSDWNKKRQQAQPYINRIRSALEKKTRWSEQIGFLRKCLKEGLTPKGLRVRLPGSILLSQHGKRLRMRSEKRVVKRRVSNLFVKLKSMDSEIADLRLKRKSFVGFSNNWIQKMENWVLKSLGKVRNEVQSHLKKKLHFLRDRKTKE